MVINTALYRPLPTKHLAYVLGLSSTAELKTHQLTMLETEKLAILAEAVSIIIDQVGEQMLLTVLMGSGMVDKDQIAGAAPLRVLREADTVEEAARVLDYARKWFYR